ncbi:MAG: Xaa-Pro aminopeptidase [Planctomycetota bacterium]|jgi:Xaa-Pro aminopeptidase
MIRGFTVCSLFLGLLTTQTTPPPIGTQPIDKLELQQRREQLARNIANKHQGRPVIIVLRGGAKQADMGQFAQDQDFLYLTGVSEPGLAMMMMIDGDGLLVRDEIMVPPYSVFSAKWDGRFLAPGEKAAKHTGFRTAGNVRALRRVLLSLIANSDQEPVILTNLKPAARLGNTPSKAGSAAKDIKNDRFDGRDSREQKFVATLHEVDPALTIASLETFVHAMRHHKSPAEIALLRRSTEIAAEGIGEAMRSVKPGAYEYQLAAVARCVFSLNGCGPDAYAAIVGGGPNGCILHYNEGKRQLRDDDLIVMDYAATLHGYCSDVTRTFPASGKFTPEQRQLVTDVYEVQQELLAHVKPGANLMTLSSMCAKMLVARGYRSDHGPCHHVGLAVHDPSISRLEAGMVITVEPGAYLPKKGYGCRIEDCVLVTDDGCEVMSKNVPSHPDAIEAWMQKAPRIPLNITAR